MKKKVLLFLMALTMVISLAACGKKEEPAAPEAGTEGAAQEKEAESQQD